MRKKQELEETCGTPPANMFRYGGIIVGVLRIFNFRRDLMASPEKIPEISSFPISKLP